MAARTSTDNQLRIHVNSDGVVEFSVSLNDTVDPSIVATMVAAVRRGIVSPPSTNPVPQNHPTSSAAPTHPTTTTATTAPTNTPRHCNPACCNQNPSNKQNNVKINPIRNDDHLTKLPNGPLNNHRPETLRHHLHQSIRTSALSSAASKWADAAAAAAAATDARSDRVPSPLVQHPTRSLSVRQIAAELERRPSTDSQTSPVTSSAANNIALYDNAREFSSSPAVHLELRSSSVDVDSSSLRRQRSGHSSTRLFSTDTDHPTIQTHDDDTHHSHSHLSPSDASTTLTDTPRLPPRVPTSESVTHAQRVPVANLPSQKPLRMQSLPTGIRRDAVNQMYFGDDASSLTGPSDAIVNEVEVRHTPCHQDASSHALSEHVEKPRQSENNQQTAISPFESHPTSVSMPAISRGPSQQTMPSHASTHNMNDKHHSFNYEPQSDDVGETEAISLSMPHLTTQSPFADYPCLQNQVFTQSNLPTVEDSYIQTHKSPNAALANDEVNKTVDETQPDVLADDVGTPSASAALLLTGATVTTTSGVGVGALTGSNAVPEKGTIGRNSSGIPGMAEHYIPPPPSQDPAQEAEDTWENVEYVLTDSYRHGPGSGMIGHSRALAGADIHAPASTRIARWRLLSTIGSKMGRRRGTGVTNGDGVEDIHQGTLAEGTPVYTDDKLHMGGKLGRGILPTLFGRNNVRNGALWLEFTSPLGMERMLAEVGKIAKSLGYQVWRRPGENKLRCIRRLTHRHEMHMVIVVGTIGLPDGPMTVVRLRRARGDRNKTEAWRYAHFYRELIERLQRHGFEISGGE